MSKASGNSYGMHVPMVYAYVPCQIGVIGLTSLHRQIAGKTHNVMFRTVPILMPKMRPISVPNLYRCNSQEL